MIGPRSVILDEADRWLFRAAIVVSLYVALRGHNAPGGGFAGGLIAGAAYVMRFLSGGALRVRRSTVVRPYTLVGIGLLVAVGTSMAPLFVGDPAQTSAILKLDLPIYGDVKVVSAGFFDIGVYLLVVGVVLTVLVALGSDPLEGES
jgi:multicomponent Na+:H+ antiporter subunit A